MLSNSLKQLFGKPEATFGKKSRRTSARVRAVVEAVSVFLCGPQKAVVLRTLTNVNPQMQFVGFVERISQRKL